MKKEEEMFDKVQGKILLQAWRGRFWEGYLKSHASRCEIPDCDMCFMLKAGYRLVPEREV